MTDVAQQMNELAEKLAREHDLDFTLASLEKLEAIIPRRNLDVETTRIWGAYLGETIRRQRPDVTRWIDYDTAAGLAGFVRDLPRSPDLEALLQLADRIWFPLSKVEKFQTNGSVDSIAAFAAVALVFAPVVDSPEQRERDRQYRADQDAELDAAAQTLLPDLSPENVCRLWRVFHARTPRSLHGQALRRIGLTVEHLMPLLGEAPRGRGWKRLYAGRDAAELIAILVHTGVAPREATTARLREGLASKARPRRMYAALALAYSELSDGRTDVALELLHARDRATVEGTWEAVRYFATLVRMKAPAPFEHDLAPMMQALAPEVCAALATTSPHVNAVLEILSDWVFDQRRCADLWSFIPALLALLTSKPAVANKTFELLQRYVWAIVHGLVPRDERVDVLRGRAELTEPFARIDGIPVQVPRRTVAMWMQVMQAAKSSRALQATPVTDEEFLEYGADSCSPRYGQFLRTYGAVRMFCKHDFRLVIQAALDDVEIESYDLIRFAYVDGEAVYFLRDDFRDDAEAPVVTYSEGTLEEHGEFEDWLLEAFERISGQYTEAEWKELMEGSPPLTLDSLAIIKS